MRNQNLMSRLLAGSSSSGWEKNEDHFAIAIVLRAGFPAGVWFANAVGDSGDGSVVACGYRRCG